MISVAVAIYKDERYIEEQIRSILPQLSYEDEIIVCDDKPGSRSESIVKRLAAEDSRIIWVEGKGKGRTYNFVHTLRHCRGDKIFVCEQGNVWLPDKVKRVMEAFGEGADLVLHNAYVADEQLNITDYSLFKRENTKRGVARNIYKNTFRGCCMAFDRKMLKRIMPIPKNIPGYDQWVGLICEIYGKVKLIDIPLMYFRDISGEREALELSSKKRFSKKSFIITKLYKRVFLGG